MDGGPLPAAHSRIVLLAFEVCAAPGIFLCAASCRYRTSEGHICSRRLSGKLRHVDREFRLRIEEIKWPKFRD